MNLENLEERLNEFKLKEIGTSEIKKYGWINPIGLHDSELLSHSGDGRTMFAAAKVEKIIPPETIRTELNKKIRAIEIETNAPVKGKAKQALKEDLVLELAGQAFTKKTIVRGYISHSNNLVVIDSTTSGAAEDFLALLRKTLGSLPVTRLTSESDISNLLTNWVVDDPAPGFTLEGSALFEGLEGAKAKFDKEDLKTDQVIAHLTEGTYFVSNLAVKYGDVATIEINQQLDIKKLKFTDVIQERLLDIKDEEEQAARADGEFCLMAGELDLLILALIAAFNVTDE